MTDAAALDHVGVVGHDLAALAAAFEPLGFTLTPRASHAGGRTGNRCIMLRESYIELLACIDGGQSATLDRFLARYAGIHIIALSIPDEIAAQQRLLRAGFSDAVVSQTERMANDADPQAPRVRFGLVTPPDPPEGRINLVRHYTPDALWQPQHLSHANHATSLDAVLLVSAEPPATAARLSRYAGRPITPDRNGGYRLELTHGAVRVLPPDVFARAFPDVILPTLPWMAGMTLRTDDRNNAIGTLLQQRGVPFRADGAGLVSQIAGCVLQFIPS